MASIVERTYQPGDEPAIEALLLAAVAAGEIAETPGNIQRILDRLPIEPSSRLVVEEDGEIAGIFLLPFTMLVVHPGKRRRGFGRRLVERAVEHQRANGKTEVPPPDFPSGVRLAPIRPGTDDEAFVALFQSAFADHPSPMPISLDAVRHVHTLPEFAAEDLILVWPDAADEPVAFIRISLTEAGGYTGGPEGEIELVAVRPEWRGHGLGRALLRWGVAKLRSRGAKAIMLAVEARNDRALGLYERTGFQRMAEWPQWSRPVSGVS